jgi:NAD(P)-dependent dehydrogenase (short-subunit alcohol dehydrogenase family)
MSFLYTQLLVKLPVPTASCVGKTVIVTGSNTGLGKEAARHFVRLGASTVILAVRSIEKGEAAKRDIETSTKCSQDVVQVWHLDMSSYESVLAFAARAEKELPRLDIAVLNAATVKTDWVIMEKDESNITVNVVSTFLLAFALLPKLKETAHKFETRPNLTIVASEVHAWARFPEKDTPRGSSIFERLTHDPQDRDMSNRYQLTKLLDVLCTRAMTDAKSSSQIPVTINCVNPGWCHSELGRELPLTFHIAKFFLARTTEAGSRTLVHAATQGPETHGQYMTECDVGLPSKWVRSTEGYDIQTRVWEELCAKLEGIKKGITANL